jgi:DNA-binding NtrC family response regulator
MLPTYFEGRHARVRSAVGRLGTAPERKAAKDELFADLTLEEVEKVTILQTLEAAGGNKSETARRLSITRRTLHKKLKKYGVM